MLRFKLTNVGLSFTGAFQLNLGSDIFPSELVSAMKESISVGLYWSVIPLCELYRIRIAFIIQLRIRIMPCLTIAKLLRVKMEGGDDNHDFHKYLHAN